MVAHWVAAHCERLLRFGEADELDWSCSALMEQLEEAVLTIGAGLSEIDNCSLVSYHFSFRVYSLAVAFHVQLLDVGSELAEGLAIRDDGSRCVALNSRPEESDQPEEKGNVFLYRSESTEMLSYRRRRESIECPPSKNL